MIGRTGWIFSPPHVEAAWRAKGIKNRLTLARAAEVSPALITRLMWGVPISDKHAIRVSEALGVELSKIAVCTVSVEVMTQRRSRRREGRA